MESSSEQDFMDQKQPGSLSKVLSSMLGVIMWIIGYDILTEDEKLQSGIDYSGEGHEK